MSHRTALAAAIAALALVGACAEKSETASAPRQSSAWLLASMPEGAKPVAEVKIFAREGDTVVVRGRIGGRVEPITKGSPVFIIMDTSIPTCDELEDDHCPTPWDYCCETPEAIAANNATVQLVTQEGAPLTADLLAEGLKPQDEVVVVGTVGPRPSETVLTIRATGVHRVKG